VACDKLCDFYRNLTSLPSPVTQSAWDFKIGFTAECTLAQATGLHAIRFNVSACTFCAQSVFVFSTMLNHRQELLQ
jgi:hypothetical protein